MVISEYEPCRSVAGTSSPFIALGSGGRAIGSLLNDYDTITVTGASTRERYLSSSEASTTSTTSTTSTPSLRSDACADACADDLTSYSCRSTPSASYTPPTTYPRASSHTHSHSQPTSRRNSAPLVPLPARILPRLRRRRSLLHLVPPRGPGERMGGRAASLQRAVSDQAALGLSGHSVSLLSLLVRYVEGAEDQGAEETGSERGRG